MQELQFDSVDVKVCQIADRFQNFFFRFTRKSKNHMNDDGQSCSLQTAVSIFEYRQLIATADKFRRFFVIVWAKIKAGFRKIFKKKGK